MEISEKETVLIVDDDSSNIMIAKKILGTRYDLVSAKSGEQALEYLKENTPELILMDIQMPVMDGFETVKKIKADERLKGIPVIFLTADRNPGTEKKCFDIGAVDYVSKPFVPDVLSSRVGRSLELEKHRKHLEVMVAERTSELVEALRVKSDFLTNMSHEIRTPMNAVLGMAEMALREEMTPAAKDYINQIRGSGKKLLVMINDILDFSNIEKGKIELIPSVYEPTSLTDDISGIFCSSMGNKKLEFVKDISPDIPKKLVGDSGRIQQIIINLLDNAVKFTERGQIGMKLYCENVDSENIILKGEISDTGTGIKEEDIPRLFCSFEQLDSTRSRTAEGIGLGLKISKQLLEIMGGSIGVKSVYGQGSVFFFELPQKIAGEQDSEDSEKAKHFAAPDAQILIVDDNHTNLTVAKGLLEPLKMNIDTAESAYKAIELAKKKKYDIIFMDHMMPSMDGVEATHTIRRSIEGYENVPIIALTANALPDAREMFIREGMTDFAAKPVGTKLITEMVHRWLPAEKIVYIENSAEEDSDNTELAIEGLNVKNAISLLGSQKLYLTVLKDYYISIDKKSDVIREYFNSQNWHDYTVEVHSLKSTSRQIGADKLSELAYELELAGKSGDINTIKEKTDALLEMYYSLKKIIMPVFPECSEEHERETASAQTTATLLDELTEALDNFDSLAIDEVIEKMMQYLYDEKHTLLLDNIAELSSEGELDSITEIVSKWRNEIKPF